MTRRGKPKLEIVSPTAEQMRNGHFSEEDIVDGNQGRNLVIGRAYRRRPMIDVLFAQKMFTVPEYMALRQYRHFASLSDRSLLRDSLADRRGSGGSSALMIETQTVEVMTAIETTARVETAAGQLAGLLRAVVVNDVSLSQWAIQQGGSLEQCREKKGKRVCSIEPHQKALRVAQLEMKIAAQRVASEISA